MTDGLTNAAGGTPVLVTGGTGFLGQRLAIRLNDLGYKVAITGRNVVVGSRLSTKGITFIQANLEDRGAMMEACRGRAYVFHCGAFSSPWGRPEHFFQSNVVGTQNVIAGCVAHGVRRLIHTSTTSIYFEFKDKYNLGEDLPLPQKMVNEYARTKHLAEQEIDRAHKAGLPVVTIRPSGIFGPGDTSILPRIIRANNERFLPILASKEVRVDITYVENVVDALLLCKDAPERVLGRKYNITNDDPICLYQYIEALIRRLGYTYKPRRIPFKVAYHLAGLLEYVSRTFRNYKEPTLTRYSVGVLTHSKTLDISAAKRDLGYMPQVSIAQATEDVIKHWSDARES